jgi:hypothetical protein
MILVSIFSVACLSRACRLGKCLFSFVNIHKELEEHDDRFLPVPIVTFTTLSIAAGAGSGWLPPCCALARIVAQSLSILSELSIPYELTTSSGAVMR